MPTSTIYFSPVSLKAGSVDDLSIPRQAVPYSGTSKANHGMSNNSRDVIMMYAEYSLYVYTRCSSLVYNKEILKLV